MYQSDTEMLFPTRVVPALRHLRGRTWQDLCETVAARPDGDEATLAFGLMMIRLNGCLSCHADSSRAMRGCPACAQPAVTRFKDTDDGLVRLYQAASQEVRLYLDDGTQVQS
jgi:hypothetical protein